MNKKKNSEPTRLGVDVAIIDGDRVLLGKRSSSVSQAISKVGEGQWAFPGGHLKPGERLSEAGLREIGEEIGDGVKVEIKGAIGISETNLPPAYVSHLIVILLAEYLGGEPVLNEPDRCEEWRWFPIDQLPVNLFPGVKEALENYKKGNSLKTARFWTS